MYSLWFKEEIRYAKCLKTRFDRFYQQYLRENKVQKGTVVSLTTTPKRISQLQPTLNSILSQSVLPEKILINLPERYQDQTPYEIPNFLKDKKLLEINIVPVDFGPATKFLPTIQKYKDLDTTIIVIDDDQVYASKMIENYLIKKKQYPNHALCLAGWELPSQMDHAQKHFLHTGKFKFGFKKTIKEDQSVDIIQGASSYMIQPDFFDDEIFNYMIAPKAAFFVDDIWISGHLAMRDIPRKLVTIPSTYIRLYNAHTAISESLHKNENQDHSHNNEIYHYFAPFWKSGMNE
jgi:hypothetical protein